MHILCTDEEAGIKQFTRFIIISALQERTGNSTYTVPSRWC